MFLKQKENEVAQENFPSNSSVEREFRPNRIKKESFSHCPPLFQICDTEVFGVQVQKVLNAKKDNWRSFFRGKSFL